MLSFLSVPSISTTVPLASTTSRPAPFNHKVRSNSLLGFHMHTQSNPPVSTLSLRNFRKQSKPTIYKLHWGFRGHRLQNWKRKRDPPSTFPCREPYRNRRKPPAFVDTLPPIWQLPFAPKSKGIVNLYTTTDTTTFRTSGGGQRKFHPFNMNKWFISNIVFLIFALWNSLASVKGCMLKLLTSFRNKHKNRAKTALRGSSGSCDKTLMV